MHLNSWAKVGASDCLQSESSILKALRRFDDTLGRAFRCECQGSLLELLKLLSSPSYINSRLAWPVSCLSVDVLFGGDAEYVSELFQDLGTCLQPPGLDIFATCLVKLRELNSSHWLLICAGCQLIMTRLLIIFSIWRIKRHPVPGQCKTSDSSGACDCVPGSYW